MTVGKLPAPERPAPIATTRRLLLRHPEPQDLEFLVGLWSDPEMTRFTGGPRDRDFLAREFSAQIAGPPQQYDLWVLCDRATGEPVGQAGFLEKTLEDGPAIEINYYIRPDRQRLGLGAEIAARLLGFAFEERDLVSVVAIIDPENEASSRVAQRIGLRPVREESRPGGASREIWRMDREGSPWDGARLAYLNRLEPARRDALLRLSDAIDANLTEGFARDFQYGMPSWVVPKSMYPKGYHVDPSLALPFIAIASQKRHIAVYHLGIYAFPELHSWFAGELAARGLKPDIGKSCIRLNPNREIPSDLIGQLCTRISPERWIAVQPRS